MNVLRGDVVNIPRKTCDLFEGTRLEKYCPYCGAGIEVEIRTDRIEIR